MKILWISYFGSWTKPLAEQIAKKYKICVVVPSSEHRKYVENGVDYICVKYSSREASQPMTEYSFKKFFPIIQKFCPDVIHVHGTEKNLAQIRKFLPNIPVIVSIQGVINGCLPYTSAYVDSLNVSKCKSIKNFLDLEALV